MCIYLIIIIIIKIIDVYFILKIYYHNYININKRRNKNMNELNIIVEEEEENRIINIYEELELVYDVLRDVEIINEDENRDDGKYIIILDELRNNIKRLLDNINKIINN